MSSADGRRVLVYNGEIYNFLQLRRDLEAKDRLFKTRSAASEAVLGGRGHLNGERVKPSKVVRVGDTIEVTIGSIRRTLAVTGVAERRGSASAAATLYAETPESQAAREKHAQERRLTRPLGADLGARPTKQARRRLDALRRAQRRAR